MHLAALFSGGKDSTYAAHLASDRRDDVVYLVTMQSRKDDSWMFHTVNVRFAPYLAQALGIEILMVETAGEKELELEDLKKALDCIDVDGLVTGAVASTYQKNRIDRICNELGLKHVAPLWGRSSPELLDEVLDAGMVFMITAIAALGLNERWLGSIVDRNSAKELKDLSEQYGFDVCGEGGELETIVLDAPWFDSRLEVIQGRKVWDGVRGSYLIEKAELRPRVGRP